jgi:hypothetical protein
MYIKITASHIMGNNAVEMETTAHYDKKTKGICFRIFSQTYLEYFSL